MAFCIDYQFGEKSTLSAEYAISRSKDLYLEMKSEHEKYEKLKELSYGDWVYTVKHNIEYNFSFGLKKAKEWLDLIASGPVENEKCDEKTHYDFCCSNLRERITDRETKITKVIHIGFDSYATEIVFEVEGSDKVFTLTIPDLEKLSTKNFNDTCYGMLRLGYQKTEFFDELIIQSYCEDDIKKSFIDFISSSMKVKNEAGNSLVM